QHILTTPMFYLGFSPRCNRSSLLSSEAEQLSERQIRRNIQYRWMLRLILRQKTVPVCTERPPAVGMTPRDRDRSFTHTHGVMHLLPTGVKKVHCGMAWFLRTPCLLFPMYQRVKR